VNKNASVESLRATEQNGARQELGLGLHEFLEKSRHFVVSTYNDIVHVVAWSCEFVLVEAAAST
jgi:hypothetical protein